MEGNPDITPPHILARARSHSDHVGRLCRQRRSDPDPGWDLSRPRDRGSNQDCACLQLRDGSCLPTTSFGPATTGTAARAARAARAAKAAVTTGRGTGDFQRPHAPWRFRAFPRPRETAQTRGRQLRDRRHPRADPRRGPVVAPCPTRDHARRLTEGASPDVLAEYITSIRLTETEREFAWYIVKGFRRSEIARLRRTAEGTVRVHVPRAAARPGWVANRN